MTPDFIIMLIGQADWSMIPSATSIAQVVAWRGGDASEFSPVDHHDPADLNVQFINGVLQPRAEQG
jgi:hypothetical protein